MTGPAGTEPEPVAVWSLEEASTSLSLSLTEVGYLRGVLAGIAPNQARRFGFEGQRRVGIITAIGHDWWFNATTCTRKGAKKGVVVCYEAASTRRK